ESQRPGVKFPTCDWHRVIKQLGQVVRGESERPPTRFVRTPSMKCFVTRLAASAIAFALFCLPCRAQFFAQTNLASNVSGLAAHRDASLQNPWGMSFGPATPFWVSNQGAGNSTLYDGTGAPQGLVVTIPGGNPTGQVFNPSAEVTLPGAGAATFLFATLGG